MGEQQNYWIIETYSNGTANVSIMSEEEVEALKKMGEIDDWMYAKCSDASEDEMIERAEDHGFEHDPW